MEAVLLIATIAAWVMIVFLIVALLAVGRAHGELSKYVQDLKLEGSGRKDDLVGKPAPDFHLKMLGQRKTVARTELRGYPTLLAFISPTCSHCHSAMKRLVELREDWYEHGGKVIGISSGDPETMQEIARELGVNFPILIEEQWEITRLYHVPGTPYGVVIGTDGTITAAGVLETIEQTRYLMSTAIRGFQPKLLVG